MHRITLILQAGYRDRPEPGTFPDGPQSANRRTKGVHSTAERRTRWGGDEIGEGCIRFSTGCEAAEDLDDVANGLVEAAR